MFTSLCVLACLLHCSIAYLIPPGSAGFVDKRPGLKLYESTPPPSSSSSSLRPVDPINSTDEKVPKVGGREGSGDEEGELGVIKAFKRAYGALQEGDSFKQAVADGIAAAGGDYEYDVELEKALEISKSKPIVMFMWKSSPACKKAIKYLNIAGINQEKIRYVELDDNWTEGNKIRAVLGRHIGKTSVPMIFFEGKYVGGCDDGLDDNEAPGLVPLAMKGTLHAQLKSIGAF